MGREVPPKHLAFLAVLFQSVQLQITLRCDIISQLSQLHQCYQIYSSRNYMVCIWNSTAKLNTISY